MSRDHYIPYCSVLEREWLNLEVMQWTLDNSWDGNVLRSWTHNAKRGWDAKRRKEGFPKCLLWGAYTLTCPLCHFDIVIFFSLEYYSK